MGYGWRALTDRGRALVAAGLTLTLSGVALGFVDLTRVGLLAVALPFLSAWALRATGPRLEVHRRLDVAAPHVDSDALVTLDLHNTSRSFALGVPAEEHLPAALGGRRRFLLERLGPGGRARLRYAVRPTRRGMHRLGPLMLRHRDPFGLASVSVPLESTTDLLVLPRVHALPSIRLGGTGPGAQGGSSQLLGATAVDDATLRGYRLGDDLRHVHWPVTAHRGQLMVRHEGRPSLRRAVLVIDPDLAGTRRSDGSTHSAALDWGVEALASIAAHLHAANYAVHVVTPETAISGEIAAESLPLEDLLRQLAVVEPTPAASPSTRGSDGDLPDAALESPVLALSRDLAAGGGALVVVVGDRHPDLARSLFGVRPASVTGLALVLQTATFDPGPPPPTSASALAALAAAGGWHTAVVDAGTSVDAVWNGLRDGEAVGQP